MGLRTGRRGGSWGELQGNKKALEFEVSRLNSEKDKLNCSVSLLSRELDELYQAIDSWDSHKTLLPMKHINITTEQLALVKLSRTFNDLAAQYNKAMTDGSYEQANRVRTVMAQTVIDFKEPLSRLLTEVAYNYNPETLTERVTLS